MAVCAQCGASTPAKVCPRCGGETSPFATPRPEGARPPASDRPPAATTVRMPVVEGRAPAHDPAETVVIPAVPAVPASAARRGEPPAEPAWARSPLPDASQPGPPPPRREPAVPVVAAPGATSARRAGGRTSLWVVLALVALLLAAGVGWWLTHRDSPITSIGRQSPEAAVLPAGASPCPPDDAPDSDMQVYRGNASTSCKLANNTKRAWGTKHGSDTVTAYSPVTQKQYAMACSGDSIVTCQGGQGAVVYLVPRTVKVVQATSSGSATAG